MGAERVFQLIFVSETSLFLAMTLSVFFSLKNLSEEFKKKTFFLVAQR